MRLKREGNWIGNYNRNNNNKYISHAHHIDKAIESIKEIPSNFKEWDEISATDQADLSLSAKLCLSDTELPNTTVTTDDYIIYTDGSVIPDKNILKQSGAAFCIYKYGLPIVESSYKLPEGTTINQCELFAILQAAKWCKTNLLNQSIHILTDSLGSIQKLIRESSTSRLLSNTHQMLVNNWFHK